MAGLQLTFGWLGNWLALLLLSMFAAEGVHFATPDVDPIARQVTLALVISWLAVLLCPAPAGHRARAGELIVWAIAAAAGFLALAWSPLYSGQGNRSLQLAGAVLVLVLLFNTVQLSIRVFASSHASSKTLFTLLAGAFIAAPLYLGVLAEAASHRTLFVDSIIAASPVSYLAGVADYDYLRSSWFYQHTPFGGLRFNYPTPGAMTVGYVVATLVLAGVVRFNSRPEQGMPGK